MQKFTDKEKYELVDYIMDCGRSGEFDITIDEWLKNKELSKAIDKFHKGLKICQPPKLTNT